MTPIPRAASLALWLNAWLRGSASPDDVLDSAGNDLHHVVLGLESEPMSLINSLAAFRRSEASVRLALPAAGDPLGLAGPPLFNQAALDAGEALILPQAGIGLVPHRVGGAIEWQAIPARAPYLVDPREARQLLARALRETTEELVALDIATWNTEIPDLLINDADESRIPTDTVAPDALASAARCRAIVDAAADVEPGAIGAAHQARFESAMRSLDAAARRVLVAICSVGPLNPE